MTNQPRRSTKKKQTDPIAALEEENQRRKSKMLKLLSELREISKTLNHQTLTSEQLSRICWEFFIPLPQPLKKPQKGRSTPLARLQTEVILQSLSFFYEPDAESVIQKHWEGLIGSDGIRHQLVAELIDRLPKLQHECPEFGRSSEFWEPIFTSPILRTQNVSHLFCALGTPRRRHLDLLVNYPDELVGETISTEINKTAEPGQALDPRTHKLLAQLAQTFPFNTRISIAKNPNLSWRVLPLLLDRGLPLHSRDALDGIEWSLFKRKASAEEIASVQKYLDRLRALSADLTHRYYHLT